MKQPMWLWMLFLGALVTVGCESGDAERGEGLHDGRSSAAGHHDDGDHEDADDDDADEHEIALSAVPANVLAAAQAALPGAKFDEAEVETENGVVTYELEATKDGAEWKVEVTADGRVLEVEQDDD